MFAYVALFGLLAFFSALGIVLSRSLLRSAAMLALAALWSAIIFYLVGASVIAALQLLVVVGGLSTYFMLSMAAKEKTKESKAMKIGYLALTIVVASFLSFMLYMPALGVSMSSLNLSALVSFAFSTYYLLIYAVILLLFFIAVASTLILKQIRR